MAVKKRQNLDFKCGDKVRVRCELISGTFEANCIVFEYRNQKLESSDMMLPCSPTFKVIEKTERFNKGVLIYGAASDVIAVYR
jgi:hypothetical protein